jgi:hypothetical protein
VSGHGVGAVAVKVLYVRPADLHELYGGCAEKGCLPVVEQATVETLSRRVAELEGALRGVIDYAAAYYTPSGEGQVAQGRALVAARAALKGQG